MYYLGVDIGGMSIKCGICDEKGKIIGKASVKTPTDCAGGLAEATAELVKNILTKLAVSKNEVVGIGIGVPGVVNVSAREVKYSCNLNIRNYKLGEKLEALTGMTVKVANDADCAAYGESLFGGGKGSSDLILITLGTGVGSGIITEGKPFAGGRGMGGEAGHMAIGGKEQCACGRIGCFETEVSATALIRRTREAVEADKNGILAAIAGEHEGKVDGRTLFEGLKRGDKVAVRVYNDYCDTLGLGIVNLVNIFRPETVLLGGGISAEGEKLTAPIQKYVDEHVYGGIEIARTLIKCAILGNDAGIIGAAFLCA